MGNPCNLFSTYDIKSLNDQVNFTIGVYFMKYFSLIFALLTFLTFTCACTYNVSMAHTEGTADDVIDDTASNTPNVSPTVNVPVTPGAGFGLSK
jgi:hypothetical protein